MTRNDGGVGAEAEDASVPSGALERWFGLSSHGTSVRTELLAGLTTFLTMAYIVFVNPTILADAGMPKEAVFVATCLVAAFGTAVMGLYANFPIGIAPGMGLNAYFAYVVVLQMGYSWQSALGAVFLSGCLFLVVTLTGLRGTIVRGVPKPLRSAIPAGIGLFLALIALKSSGIVAASPATFVTLGELHDPKVLLAVAGLVLIVVLDQFAVRGAILIGILAVTLASFPFAGNNFGGVVSAPPSISATFMQLDVKSALSTGFINIVLVFFLVELFDATGTLMGVARRAGLIDSPSAPAAHADGPDRLNRALLADSVAIVAGAGLGTSSATAYVESASGVQAGGRTGLTALTVAVLFLASLFLAPLAGSVPAYATAPALLYVACLMLRDLVDLDWGEPTDVVPAVITAITMPFTYSIANGLAFGFISYAVLKLLTGRAREVHWIVWIIAALFVAKFALIGGQ